MVASSSMIGPPPLACSDRNEAWLQGNTRMAGPAPLLHALAPKFQEEQPAQVGLQNMGNTCYCNSVLQCLAFVPPLGNLLRKDPQGLHRGHGCHLSSGKCAACLLTKQLIALLTESPRSIRPIHVVCNLSAFSKTFTRGRQEDSHEFFHCLLEAVERDTKQGQVSGDKAMHGNHTLIEQLFQGCSISQVRCLSCGHESNTYEVFCSLSLDIGKAASVQDSLSLFSAAESLDGMNKYRCDKCRALVQARKQVAIWDEPNVLTLHLKRFNASPFSGGKLGRHVQFPAQLDLEPYAAHRLLQQGSPSVPSARYQLVGVLVHQGGSVHSGHYYSFVRDSRGQWSCANDESVYRVGLEHVLQQQAYMLFYVRTAIKVPRHPPKQQGNGAAASPAACMGPALPPAIKARSGAVPNPSGFIGPALPPVMTGKRSRAADEDQIQPQDFQGKLGASTVIGQATTTTLMLPSNAANRTTVLPAKLPAKLPWQQRSAQAETASAPQLQLPAPASLRPAASAVKAVPHAASSSGSAVGRLSAWPRQPALEPLDARTNGDSPSIGNRHALGNGYSSATSHAGMEHRAQQPKRPCPLSWGSNGLSSGVAPQTTADVNAQSRVTDRDKLKAKLLEELRCSRYAVAVREGLQDFFANSISKSSGRSQEELLDEALKELEMASSDEAKALRSQLRPVLQRLAPDGFLMRAKDDVGILLSRAT